MKNLTGRVVSTKMAKTIVVSVERQKVHPLYKKIIKRSKRIKVHSEDETIKTGDLVKIAPTKPMSKEKHYKLVAKI